MDEFYEADVEYQMYLDDGGTMSYSSFLYTFYPWLVTREEHLEELEDEEGDEALRDFTDWLDGFEGDLPF